MDDIFFYMTLGGATLILICGAIRFRHLRPTRKGSALAPPPPVFRKLSDNSRDFQKIFETKVRHLSGFDPAGHRERPTKYSYTCQDCGQHFVSPTRIEHIFLCSPCLNVVAGISRD